MIKEILGMIFIVFLLANAAIAVADETEHESAGFDRKLDDAEVMGFIEKSVAKNNQALPMSLGSGLRLEPMTSGPGKRINIFLTWTADRNALPDGVLNGSLDEMTRYLCSTPGAGMFIRNQAEASFTLQGLDGAPIEQILMKFEKDCDGVDSAANNPLTLSPAESKLAIDPARQRALNDALGEMNKLLPSHVAFGIYHAGGMAVPGKPIVFLFLVFPWLMTEPVSEEHWATFRSIVRDYVCNGRELSFLRENDIRIKGILYNLKSRPVGEVTIQPGVDCVAATVAE